MLRGVNWGCSLLFFIVLESAFDSCSSFLSVRVGPLRLACYSEQLSLLSGKRPRYYPPVWNTCLPIDTVLPLLQADLRIETKRKG